MKLPIRVNGQDYEVPTSYSDLTVRQYREITRHIDEIASESPLATIRLLSIFTGIDYETLINFDCSQAEVIIPVLPFSRDIDLHSIKRPEKIRLGTRTFDPIDTPKKKKLGQKLVIESLVVNAKESNKHFSEIIAPIVACYYSPMFNKDEKFTESQMKAVEELVLDAPVIEMFPEANFFFSGFMTLKR